MRQMKIFGSIVGGLVLGGAAFALAEPFAAAQSVPGASSSAPTVDPAVEAARIKYVAMEWARGDRRIGFALGEFSIAGLTGSTVEFHAGGVSRRFDDATGVGRVLIEMSVNDEVAGAHDALLHHIAYVQSTKTLPTASSRGIVAGDIGYIGHGGRDGSKIAWLAFTVGNLEFRVQDLNVDAAGAVAVRPVIEQLAAQAAAMPVVPAGVVLPRPSIERFTAEASSVVAGESVLLDIVGHDSDGKPVAVDFIVGGSNQGQGYVEQDEQARWRFNATGAGATQITLEARSRLGTKTTRTIEVTVTR
ncbi:MAG: hypothetical protein EXS13_08095 [Planctomycetes bacterium]|nr:hypothetical protein [Planctomycetota bacterium]